jgi:hypothetical protein
MRPRIQMLMSQGDAKEKMNWRRIDWRDSDGI